MKNNKGITLVEILGALAILGIIVVVIMSVFSNGANSSERTTSRQQLQQESNLIIEQIRSIYLKNEKKNSVPTEFKIKVKGSKLVYLDTNNANEKIISSGYEYTLINGDVNKEILFNRTKATPFHLKISENNQEFNVKTTFSKLK
ncbi:hypothetical protein Plano_1143 [Planococcus sp. PAMC 21323]|uniref:type II secretion system protein n=1 Tax=Planococcus sp. PAMC 21323 TaxID=1526927 RepID=UPI00056DEA70|nr:type II secretion system protein [Planococcus sp. PAMC 21323]AIY05108.1 hypothetical protein Plano_1143 [Planococcus sp. PAMC 21323]